MDKLRNNLNFNKHDPPTLNFDYNNQSCLIPK